MKSAAKQANRSRIASGLQGPAQRFLEQRAVLRGALRLLFRSLVRPPMPIALQRGVLRLLTAATPTPRGLSLTPGQIGGRPCEWHRPPEENGRVLLYLHGGAYLIGSPATHRGISATLAKLGQRAVCTLDYRLAPEHPFPAGYEDYLAVYRWARYERRSDWPIVGVAGDSIGGCFAAACTVEAVKAGEVAPDFIDRPRLSVCQVEAETVEQARGRLAGSGDGGRIDLPRAPRSTLLSRRERQS